MMKEIITNLCLWIIFKLNGTKDRCLAKRLKDLADVYDPMGTI